MHYTYSASLIFPVSRTFKAILKVNPSSLISPSTRVSSLVSLLGHWARTWFRASPAFLQVVHPFSPQISTLDVSQAAISVHPEGSFSWQHCWSSGSFLMAFTVVSAFARNGLESEVLHLTEESSEVRTSPR
ncbi:hypothetical protein Mapa_013879 [Marchantia paleacea]|nr:hypothetical protein Mapa_013879 [Marchantia paleacea]